MYVNDLKDAVAGFPEALQRSAAVDHAAAGVTSFLAREHPTALSAHQLTCVQPAETDALENILFTNVLFHPYKRSSEVFK